MQLADGVFKVAGLESPKFDIAESAIRGPAHRRQPRHRDDSVACCGAYPDCACKRRHVVFEPRVVGSANGATPVLDRPPQPVPNFVAGIAFVVGTFMYDFEMYGSRPVPRWLSGWGLVGAVLSLVSIVYTGFTQDFGFTTVNSVLMAPIGLQEMVLAVWLIVKGFNP